MQCNACGQMPGSPKGFGMLGADHGFSFETVPQTRQEPGRAQHQAIIRVAQKKDLDLLRRTVQLLGHKVAVLRAVAQEDRLERLVEALIDDEPRSAFDTQLETDNAALRANYLETVASYTAADLHALAGSRAANKSALAGGWKDNGRIFAVPFRGVDRFPAFQFADGQPRPVVKQVLARLPRGMTPWQTAFWFASGNGWLDGAAPQDCLADRDAVVTAATRMSDPTVG